MSELRDFDRETYDKSIDGLVGPYYFYNFRNFDWKNPTREQAVGSFLFRLHAEEKQNVNRLAKDFHIDGHPLAHTVVLIPVAAHQEASNIANAVDQYVQQENCDPFSMLLYPNAPLESSQTAIDDTMQEIEKAQKKYPGFDLRTSLPDIYEHPTIGTIRRTLWNSALLLSQYEGAFANPRDEVIGLNNDIDIVRQSPRNIMRIQNIYKKQQAELEEKGKPHAVSTPRAILLKHAYDTNFPNASLAAFWEDFLVYQERPYRSYEAGLIFPFSYYADRGGIKAGAVIHETTPLFDRTATIIPGTVLETSNRRYIERLHKVQMKDIWTRDSFGATNDCRDEDMLVDISHERLEEVIKISLDKSMHKFFTRPNNIYRKKIAKAHADGIDTTDLFEEFVQALERKERLAHAILERVMNLPDLARTVHYLGDSRSRAKNVVRLYLPPGY